MCSPPSTKDYVRETLPLAAAVFSVYRAQPKLTRAAQSRKLGESLSRRIADSANSILQFERDNARPNLEMPSDQPVSWRKHTHTDSGKRRAWQWVSHHGKEVPGSHMRSKRCGPSRAC